MHEFVLTGGPMKKALGIRTLDLAKRLLDFGFHPPTVYFPLLVDEALLIEPTETETRETLDAFAEVVGEILAEAAEDPEAARNAPYTTPVRRLDEAGAAKRPVIRQTLLAVVIFSGIQPTGRKHLGNHIGAIVQYVEGQDRADPSIYCIVDLHAVTVPYEPAELRERVYDTTAILIAAGLDPERCILFRQGDVHPAHRAVLAAHVGHARSARSTGCTSSATSRPPSASWSPPAC